MSAGIAHPSLDLTRVFGARARGLTDLLVSALRQAVPVEEIWLFGSCARGTAGPNSDLDLLVVLRDDHGLSRPTLECFKAVNHLTDAPPTDVLAISKSRWARERTHRFGLFGDAGQDGICLYAK